MRPASLQANSKKSLSRYALSSEKREKYLLPDSQKR
jgi:hypothetical protein